MDITIKKSRQKHSDSNLNFGTVEQKIKGKMKRLKSRDISFF